ncbi:MAG: hypothetical protein RL404_746 [Pseudomonadota bacterium]
MPVSQPKSRSPLPVFPGNGAHFELHEGHVPAGAAAQMESLYGSLYASLPQLQLSGLAGAGTYIERQGSVPSAIFLYRRDGDALRVINEGMRIDAGDAERFALRMFARLPALRSVHWHAIRIEGLPRALPVSRFDCSEDIVLELPATAAAYLKALGKATRKSLRQRLARAEGLSHRVLTGPASADRFLIDRIVAFNHARLARKSRRSALDASAASKLQLLMRARGMAGLAHIDGRLRGGTLACRIADDVYSLVNAHDPDYDALGLGNLCRHLMILSAIRAGARRFHLLGGNYASKRACLAERITLQHVVLHRDRWQRLLDWRAQLGWRLAHAGLRVRRRIDDARHGVRRD